MAFLRDIIAWAVAETNHWTPEMKALTVVGGAIGALGTIITTIYKILRWYRGQPNNFDPKELARALIEAQQQAGLIQPSPARQADEPLELTQLTVAIEAALSDLREERARVTKEKRDKIDEALIRLRRGQTDQAEALFQTAAINEEARQAKQSAARAYRNIGALAFLSHTQKALDAYEKSVILDFNEPLAWNQLGMLFKRVGRIAEAERAFGRVLTLADQLADNSWEGSAYLNLSLIYRMRGDFDQAEKAAHRALSIYQQLGRKEAIAAAYVILGSIYQKLGDLGRAEDAILRGLELFDALGERSQIANACTILGGIYALRGDLANAESVTLRALKILEELGWNGPRATAYGILAGIFLGKNDVIQAEEMALKSLTLYKELDHKEGLASAYSFLGLIYHKRMELLKAEEAILKSIKLFEGLGMKSEMASMYGMLGEIGMQQGDRFKACAYWEKARQTYVATREREKGNQIERRRQEAGCYGL